MCCSVWLMDELITHIHHNKQLKGCPDDLHSPSSCWGENRFYNHWNAALFYSTTRISSTQWVRLCFWFGRQASQSWSVPSTWIIRYSFSWTFPHSATRRRKLKWIFSFPVQIQTSHQHFVWTKIILALCRSEVYIPVIYDFSIILNIHCV